MKTEKFQFPLEDDYSSKVIFDTSNGFTYLPRLNNGVYIKAPFDCRVKQIEIIEGEDDTLSTWYNPWNQSYKSHHIVYESLDKKVLFSASGMLPNDKSKNIGAIFKKGENVGRVLTNTVGFSFKYYDQNVINGEEIVTDKKPETVIEEIKGDSPAPLSDFKKVILFAELTVAVLAASYVYKSFKGK